MFVKKVFQLVKPFLANLHYTVLVPNDTQICTQCTPKIFKSFFEYEYPKYAEFHADFKSVEMIEKECTQKKLFAKSFCKLVVPKMKIPNFAPFFACNFFVSEFLHFSQQFRNQRKILHCFDTRIQKNCRSY
jgi:hypothetical protein